MSSPRYIFEPHLRPKTENPYFTCGQMDKQRGAGLPTSCLPRSSPGLLPVSYCVNSTASEASHPLGSQRKWQEVLSTPISHDTSRASPATPQSLGTDTLDIAMTRQILRLTEGMGEALDHTGPSVLQIREGTCGCAAPCHYHITTYSGPGPLFDDVAGMEVTEDMGISLHRSWGTTVGRTRYPSKG